jgi:23S rRNA (cytidine1920-2'-O)/16S rRNA (cytidine1409-2'-O)-methyltransferase
MAKAKPVRVDVLLFERGLSESRAKAQAQVLAGQVYSGDIRVDKAGTRLASDAPLVVRERERYVSRGGYKLEGALDELKLEVADLVCIDVGASTGGFTDCLLQRGAKQVFAVDVGQGLLAHRVATDARVVVMDRTNARYLEATSFPVAPELVVVDASFIGLGQLLPALARVIPEGRLLLAMVKPQFEVGREAARRARGVITDPEMRADAILRVKGELAEHGFEVTASADSTLAGPKGNVEHFVLARKVC